MILYQNQINETTVVGAPVQRIISLVPSLTELLYDLGLRNEVTGITKFCVHPKEWFKTKQRVGGTKSVDIKKVHDLQPTLVIANKEENVKEQVEEISSFTNVYLSDIDNLESALQAIHEIGLLVSKKGKALQLTNNIKHAFDVLASKNTLKSFEVPLRTAYLIWRNPYMAAGGGTFINDMMQRCGFINIYEHEQRYPEINIKQLAEQHCELLLLSSEPFPFSQKHIDELVSQLPGTKILLVDGEMFSWYGSRLMFAARYFQALLKPLKNDWEAKQ